MYAPGKVQNNMLNTCPSKGIHPVAATAQHHVVRVHKIA